MSYRKVGRRLSALSLFAARLVFSIVLASCATAPLSNDYRSRMQSITASTVFDAPVQPDLALLPTGREWVTHIRQDLLPYWTTPVALGNPIGNFPTFRANDRLGNRS